MEYLSIAQISEKWGLTKRRIQVLCAEGRVTGAKRIGTFWAIPEDAEKPKDARIKSGKYCKIKENGGNQTLQYYEQNAEQFIENTVYVDFRDTQLRFLNKLSKGSYILDFGCGSGRDTRYFLEQGYQVDAIDGSKELCKRASAFAGIEVRQMLFHELKELEKYDGIWACSSILHLSYEELQDIFPKMIRALKKQGVIYTSFKYGTFSGMRNGRFFTDFTEEMFEKFIGKMDGIQIEEYWITGDARAGREDEKWLNLILRKA